MVFENGISIIGSGNVAWHLAVAFKNVQIPVNMVVSRSKQNANELAEYLGTKSSDNLNEIPQSSSFILICVSDNEVEKVIESIKKLTIPIAHTSASLSIDVFRDYTGNSGVFYPFQTFTKGVRLGKLKIPVCIESNNQDMRKLLYKLADKISDKILEVDSEKRKILHIAGIFANNFTNYMFVNAYDILKSNNIEPEILNALIAETFNKLHESTPEYLQTGPARRNVKSIINEHIIRLNKNKQQQELYSLISAYIIQHYNNEG